MMNGSKKSFPYNEKTILIRKYGIPEGGFSSFWEILSSDEMARCSAFVFDKDRERYIFCRGVLRILLSEFTGIEPSQVPLKYTQSGKPYLCSEACLFPVKFNLAHTENAMMIALSLDTELGIDLELERPIREISSIVRNYFSVSEQQYMRQFLGEHETKAFFHCWTRKEALFKGLGSGIVSKEFQSISCLDSLLELSSNTSLRELWTIETLLLSSKYSAAIAYRGRGCRLLLSEWEWQS